MTPPIISLIAARGENGVIGAEGGLPWHLPSDLKFFKSVTLGKPVLMGRVTFDDIYARLGRALPGRPNLVLTRNQNYRPDGAKIFTRLPAMIGRGCELAGAMGADEVMIIGGAQLYAAALPFAHRLYLTEVAASPAGDAVFPQFDPRDWPVVSRHTPRQSARDEYEFRVDIREKTR